MALSYTPAPHELAYYDGLFQATDQSRTGSIGGAQAVAFFQTSKLPVDVLKNIWTLADQNPTTNSLDRRKFHIAVRLIELSQNGQKAQGANLATPPGVTLRPVVFEGVSGVSVPMPPAPGAAPPPQQQQQQPPPQQQQQPAYRQPSPVPPSPIPQQTLPSPYRQPSPIPQQQQPAAVSQALTAQDPYTMLPGDLARYEQLFPTYEVKKDGYVYGKEAVELFTKSGILQNQLREIWNMVDVPVDNRLDELEFAMAMHLIVCVSKKHLPLPSALPMSLKILKQQQEAAAAAQQQQQQMFPEQQQMGRPPLHPPQPGLGAPSSPGYGAPTSPSHGAPPAIQTVGSTDSGSLPGPPPIVPHGGASIHDAFEGLSTPQSFDSHGPPQLPEPTAAAPSMPELTAKSIPEPTPAAMSIPEPTPASSYPQPEAQAPAPTPVMAPAPVEEQPKDTKALASSYDMGDDHAELEKLKIALQKLQAEKIALQAQLGSLSEEEREVQKEIAATIHEVGELSNELTGLRAKVIASKSALIEATAELKAAKEKKGMVNDMLSETKETNEALDAAHAAITAVNTSSALQQNHAPAPASFQGDLFGFDDGPAPAFAPEPAPAPENSPVPAPVPAADVANPSPAPHVSPVSSDDAAVEPDSRALPVQPELSSKPEPLAPAPAAATWDPMAIQKNPSYEEYGVMGGESPTNKTDPVWGAAVATVTSNSYSVPSAPSAEEVQEIKQKLSQAEETARDAEEQRRKLAERADQLKREAATVQQAAKDKEAHAQEKKRGFGRGKKKEKREAEKMTQEALDKKRQFMEAQAEAQNAQTMASELKHEADKLRKEAEQAELALASAASVVVNQREAERRQNDSSTDPAANGGTSGMQSNPAPVKSEFGNGDTAMGGFGGFGVMGGGGPAMGGGGGPGIPTPSNEGYGDGLGFGVMGGGGGGGGDDIHIPTPPQSAAGDDPYNNPFQ